MQNEPHARKRCGAKTRAGKPCKNGAMANGRCRMHGGKSTGAPPEKMQGNQNSKKHGFFSRYIPEETLELMGMIEKSNPIDLLWDQIQIQYAAIIRAQKVMHVATDDDHLKEESGYSSGMDSSSTSYKVVYAHERYHSFLTAQSRAMAELRNMFKQYDELLRSDLATEEQKTRIELLKAQVPNSDPTDMNKQIVALADLINKPAPDRVIDDE